MKSANIKTIYERCKSSSLESLETRLQNPDSISEDALMAYRIAYKEKTQGISSVDEEINRMCIDLNQMNSRVLLNIGKDVRTVKNIILFWFVCNIIAAFLIFLQIYS